MARIDITSIPNAPGLPANPGVMEPTLQSAEPVMQGMSRLRQESMPLDAFSGEAKGMQAVGAGIGQLATPLNQFADAMSRAKILSDMAEVDKVKIEHTGMLKDALLTAPADQYEKIWQDSIPEMQKKLDALDISPAAKSKANPEMVRYIAETGVMVRSSAQKLKISNMRDSISTAAQGDIDNGNYDGAINRINQAVGTIFSKPEGDKMIQKIKSDQQRQGWQQIINSDPIEALKVLQEDLPKGDSSTFQGANPVELYRLTETARAEVNRQRIDAIRNIENQIDSGAITNNDQLKTAAGKTLDDVSIMALQNRMKNTMGPSPETWLRIQNEIDNLEPKDPKDPGYQDFQTKWLAIKSDVNQNVGTQWRGSMESQLYQKIQRSTSGKGLTIDEKVQNAGFQRLNYLYENGAFGQFNSKKDESGQVAPAELAKQTTAYSGLMDMRDHLSQAIKSGQVPNTYAGINQWINDNLNDAQKKILGNKLNQPAQSGFLNGVQNFLEDPIGTLKGTPTPPYSIYDEAKARSAGPKPSPTPLPQGAIPAPKGSKVTNYWPTEVKGKDGIVGNHENHLQSGDFAASPDIEESLKANGVKPGDTVLIHLSDGDTIPAKFSDSTAQDDQRKAEGKAPLRGRFDLWTATKGHPKDGVAVVGYSLPNRQS